MANSNRILITGANGFVGYWLRRHLLEVLPTGCEVISTSKDGRLCSTLPSDALEVPLALDITDDLAVEQVIKNWRPDVIIHLAAVSNVVEAGVSPKKTFAINVGGTISLALHTREYCPEALFVFVSTSEVYGESFIDRTSPIDEDAVLSPMNVYAASKAAADLFVGQMSRNGLRSVRFRPFNHTGPGQSEDFVVSSFAAQIARIEKGLQEPVIKVGNLEAIRDFADVRDIAAAYVSVATSSPNELRSGLTLNLSTGVGRRVGDILAELLSLSGHDIKIVEDPNRMRPSEIRCAIGDSRRARELLKWSPKNEWRNTLELVLNYWRSQV
ncbi:GDP-mannose 4,6-dehydratase [Agrobacterium salinitolerans]|uniref:GDP-mannose 4,6-dehydratase n=1 Tax=Agrobacterium salinitolerans TaxID=1183413 RepID=UPI00174A54F8